MRGRKLAQPAVREDPSRAGVEVGEAHRVAVKRVTIVEPRGLGSRVRSEGPRARAIGEKPSNLKEAFSRSRSLRCLSELGYASWVFWVGDSIRPLVRKPDALCGLSPYVASSSAAPGAVGVSQPLRHITNGLQ